jgi:hypothetical protein
MNSWQPSREDCALCCEDSREEEGFGRLSFMLRRLSFTLNQPKATCTSYVPVPKVREYVGVVRVVIRQLPRVAVARAVSITPESPRNTHRTDARSMHTTNT